MDDRGLLLTLIVLSVLGAGCPADSPSGGETAAQTTTDGSSGPIAAGSGTSGDRDVPETTGPGPTTEQTSGTTAEPATTTGVGSTSEGGTTSSGGASTTGSGERASTSTGDVAGTTGELEEYACNGYWFAACSFCLQQECAADLAACEETDGCCCLAFCVAGGNDTELCQLECGLEAYSEAADDLLACMSTECGGGGQCPMD